MPTTYKPASVEDHDFLRAVRDEFEPELWEADVTVKFMFAVGEQDDFGVLIKPPLVKKGVRSIAEVKINGLKDRAEGKADATIFYDWHLWEEHNEARRRAVLHHELHHLKVKQAKHDIERDDLDRPVLKMRPHDFEVGWFHCIAEIHGHNAVEVQQARLLTTESGQLLWPWAPDADKGLTEVEIEARNRMRQEKRHEAKREKALAGSR